MPFNVSASRPWFWSSSVSTEKSQRVSLLSAEATASTDSSRGSKPIEVIADVCHLILVIESISLFFPESPAPSILKSHILNSPLSSPDASKNLVEEYWFQLMTFMSQSLAFQDIWHFIWVARRSQSLMVVSLEHVERTCS